MFTSLTAVAALPAARLWLLALAFVAFAAFAAFSTAPRFAYTNAIASARTETPAQFARPIPVTVFADGSCGNGAYVTGDMAGDASPASVYDALCGK
jgi:hypothetical protein